MHEHRPVRTALSVCQWVREMTSTSDAEGQSVYRDDEQPERAQKWSGPLVVVIVVIVAVILATIGLSLAGLRVFHGTDILESFAPWRSVPPDGVVPTNPLVGDTVDALMPARAQFAERLAQGDIAMWQPNVLGGRPLASIPNGAYFSPLSLPFWVFPLWYATGLVKLLELAVSIGFTFLFVRRLGLSKASGLVGGLVFAFSGFQVAWNNWPQTHVGALIAALYWSIEVAISNRRVAAKLPLAFVVAVMWFEGFPSVTGYALVFGGAYAIARTVSLAGMMERIRALGMAAVAVVVGTSIAAIQLLPFVDSLSALDLSNRVQSSGIRLPLRALATFVVPNAFGSPVDRNYYGPMNYIEIQSFVGIAAVLLAILALVYGNKLVRKSIHWYFMIAALVSLVLLYVGGPLLALLQLTPLFGINFVGRLRSVQGFLIAVLAAIGFEVLVRSLPAFARWRSRILFGIFVLVTTLVLGGAIFRAWQMARTNSEEAYLYRNLIVAVSVLVLALTAIALAHSSRRSLSRVPLVVLPVLVGIEIVLFAMPFWPQIPREEFYPVTPTHEFLASNLGEDRIVSAGLAMYPGSTTFYGLRSVTGHAFHDPAWQDLLEAVDPNVMDASPTFSILASRSDIGAAPIFDRLGARYFVADPRVALAGTRLAGAAVVIAGSPASFEISIPVTGVPRGITLFIDEGLDPGNAPDLFVLDLLDESGGVLASGFRRTARYLFPGTLEVPVSWAEAGTASTMRLTYEGDNAVNLRTNEAGEIEYELIMDDDDGLMLVYGGGTVIYERLNALPRIRWAGSAAIYPDSDQRIAALASGVDPDTVVLSEDSYPGSGSSAQIETVRDDGDSILIDIQAEGDGYLVVADTMQRDWIATLDDQPVPILAADHALAAVAVPAGENRLLLTYVPERQQLGTLVSLSALLVCLAVGLASMLRGKGRRESKESM